MRPVVSCRTVRHEGMGRALAAASVMAVSSSSAEARAWVFSEHACLTGHGVQQLRDEDRAELERAWDLARETADGKMFCTSLSAPRGTPTETCKAYGVGAEDIDDEGRWCMRFDALPAFAADHSCRPFDLVSRDAWIRRVLVVSRELMNELDAAEGDVSARIRAWRDGHIDLMVEDRYYLSRASGNDSHFQATRYSDDLGIHLRRALGQGQPSNASASYANYHAAALALADESRTMRALAPELAQKAALDAFLVEAFALHFLEDAFSAGHVVGTWGRSLDRKGTHDWWCEHGLDARTWAQGSYIAHGDAFLAAEDRRHAAGAVRISLRQLAQAFRGEEGVVPDCRQSNRKEDGFCRAVFDGHMDACTANTVPADLAPLASEGLILAALVEQPMPARQEPALPRFGQEAGLHFGPSAAIDGHVGWRSGDFQNVAPRGRLGLRVGLDLTDILTQYDDTQALAVEGLLVAEHLAGSTLAGVGGRVRAPFYAIPGDIVWTAPLAIACNARWCRFPLRRAAAGSVYWRIQRPVVLGENTSFQFVLGRDVGFTVLERHPNERTARVELFGPLVTLRRAYPTGGRPSTSFAFELGPQLTWIDGSLGAWGVYASLGASTNVYVWAP